MKTQKIKGLKFLSPDLASYYSNKRTDYTPALSGWMTHPDCAKADGRDCGPGGYHIMLKCSSTYAPLNWWPWHAYGKGILGKSPEKARVKEIRLRPIPAALWWRYLRRFGSSANLSNADFRSADLSNSNFGHANFTSANLSFADLSNSKLSNSNFNSANLTSANLSFADLSNSNFNFANLTSANFGFAKLGNSNFNFADLRSAYFGHANFTSADLSFANLSHADLRSANFRSAKLSGAKLGGAAYNNCTLWPIGFNPEKAGARKDPA